MIQITFKTLKRIVNNFLYLPVTRVEVLKHAKELQGTHQYSGLCWLLNKALEDYGLWWADPLTTFPEFKFENARHFGAYTEYGYWWEEGRWDTGRLDFLNWLIQEYKDDRMNIRKLINYHGLRNCW